MIGVKQYQTKRRKIGRRISPDDSFSMLILQERLQRAQMSLISRSLHIEEWRRMHWGRAGDANSKRIQYYSF